MEQRFAQIEGGIVVNIVIWNGVTAADLGGWPPPEDATMIPLDDGSVAITGSPTIGWPAAPGADGSWTFSEPPKPVDPVLSPEQIVAANTATRNQMLAAATLAIAPLQDADDLGEATSSETALLKAWKQFRVAVNRVDLTRLAPSWPAPPQPGYGAVRAPADEVS